MFARESALDDARADPERVHGSGRVEGSKGQTPAPGFEPCFVYILTCADGSYYVGSTSDVAERWRIHNEGHGAACTASRRPVCLVFWETLECWPAAAKPSSNAGRGRRRTPSSRGTEPRSASLRGGGAADPRGGTAADRPVSAVVAPPLQLRPSSADWRVYDASGGHNQTPNGFAPRRYPLGSERRGFVGRRPEMRRLQIVLCLLCATVCSVGWTPAQKEKPTKLVIINTNFRTPSSLDELVDRSSLIVVGRVLGGKAHEGDLRRKTDRGATTAFRVMVSQVARHPQDFDPSMREILVAQNGGLLDRGDHFENVVIDDFPLLRPGTDYVMFLAWNEEHLAWTSVMGPSGVFALESGRVRWLGPGEGDGLRVYDRTPLTSFMGLIEGRQS